jgi:mono/diheme cytochrome c family protein
MSIRCQQLTGLPRRSLMLLRLVLCFFPLIASIVAADTVSYSQHIQPIFAQHCLQCHGPDAEQRKADLRLDVAASATQSAILPGAANESELLDRLTSDDSDLKMPPGPDSLSPEQIELVRQWIDQGAHYERHWAFEPIQNQVEIPEVEGHSQTL